MEVRSKGLKYRKKQFYNNLATVLQEIHLMKRQTNGERSKALKQRKVQFYYNLATVLQEKRLITRETNGSKK